MGVQISRGTKKHCMYSCGDEETPFVQLCGHVICVLNMDPPPSYETLFPEKPALESHILPSLQPNRCQSFFHKSIKGSFSQDREGSAEYYGELDHKSRLDGVGTLRWHSGDIYQGSFKKGQIHGEGYFYSFKSNQLFWIETRKNKILKKTEANSKATSGIAELSVKDKKSFE